MDAAKRAIERYKRMSRKEKKALAHIGLSEVLLIMFLQECGRDAPEARNK